MTLPMSPIQDINSGQLDHCKDYVILNYYSFFKVLFESKTHVNLLANVNL